MALTRHCVTRTSASHAFGKRRSRALEKSPPGVATLSTDPVPIEFLIAWVENVQSSKKHAVSIGHIPASAVDECEEWKYESNSLSSVVW